MKNEDLLFHYCSSETFASIINTKTIWLSSLKFSNDSSEGKLVSAAIMRMAGRDELDELSKARLLDELSVIEEMCDGLGFCLSNEGDLLSQWRGYGDDAHGLSIGFNQGFLTSVYEASKGSPDVVVLKPVVYEEFEHDRLLDPVYSLIRQTIDHGGVGTRTTIGSLLGHSSPAEEKSKKDFDHLILSLIPLLYQLKPPAFKEEKEWRLIRHRFTSLNESCSFYAKRSCLTPYVSTSIDNKEIPAIGKVITGPRHKTPPNVIRSMLRQAGFGDVEVERSAATYR